MNTIRNFMRLTLPALFAILICDAGQSQEDTLRDERPFVRGGAYDKPFVTRLFGRTAIGGYAEALWKLQRKEGVTEEIGFEARRFNMFMFSRISDRVRLFAELEFEHGTEEINIEFAAVDFELHPSLNFRGGIILSPLGKFNLTHDSPLNDLTDRPLVSTQVIPTALSEAGMGVYGSFHPSIASRFTYEVYVVNGFNDGVVLSGPGTRIREGRGSVGEDNNPSPSFVGRIGASPFAELEVGVSLHTGPYNRYKIGKLFVEETRNLSIMAFDWEYNAGDFDLLGEYAHATVDIPPSLRGLYAERQQGLYSQVNYRFGRAWIASLQQSYFTAAARYEFVDFDSDIGGDAHQRLSVGLNFRPTSDTVFKFDYHHDWEWSRVNVLERGAGVNLSIATYF
jgi:hypothetical protein